MRILISNKVGELPLEKESKIVKSKTKKQKQEHINIS